MLLMTTPQEEPKYLRHSPCMQPVCLTCFPSTTGDHHVQDLSQDLGTTPGSKSKPTNIPTAPPNHLISILSTKIKQATLDNDLESLNTLLHLSRSYWESSIWYWYEFYDFDVLLDSMKAAFKLKKLKPVPLLLSPNHQPHLTIGSL